MASPIFPYSIIAVSSASLAVADGAASIPWTEGTIATAVIGVSLFWIRRSDNDARRERTEMRTALNRQSRAIAALVKGYTEAGLPLPADYISILNEKVEEHYDQR